MPSYIKISDLIKKLKDIDDQDSYIIDCDIYNVHSHCFLDILMSAKEQIVRKNREFLELMLEMDFSYCFFDYHKILTEKSKSKESLINAIEAIKYNDNLTQKGKDYETNLRHNQIKKIDRLLYLAEGIHKEQIDFEKTFTEQQVGKIYHITMQNMLNTIDMV
jgi:hypothetical protein